MTTLACRKAGDAWPERRDLEAYRGVDPEPELHGR